MRQRLNFVVNDVSPLSINQEKLEPTHVGYYDLRKIGYHLIFCWMCSLGILAETPSVQKITPWSVAPGKTTELVLTGSNLATASNIWFSFPCSVSFVSRTDDKAVCRVSLPKNVSCGPAGWRVANQDGVSALQMIIVDDLPSQPLTNENNSTTSAALLQLPIAVDGKCSEGKSDYFKFRAAKGERVAFEVVAQRLGSTLDSVLRLLDERGRELHYCEDDPGLGADSRFSHTFTASGEYVLELHDAGFQGGGKYHLRIGNFPLVIGAYPLSVAAGSTDVRLELAPADIGGDVLAKVSQAQRQFCDVRFKPEGPGGFFAITTSDFPPLTEKEPNDDSDHANVITLPCTINGRFEKPGDRDFYQFTAAKGEKVLLQAKTRSLGSPCDVYMKVIRTNGAEVAEVNLSALSEGAITNTFKESGTYRLLVEELNRRGEPGFNYVIDASVAKAEVALSIEVDRVQLPVEGSARVKITAERFGYDGPISITANESEKHFSLGENVIPEKKNDVEIEIKPATPISPGQIFTLELAGRTTNRQDAIQVSTAAALRKLFPSMIYPPAEFDGVIGVGVKK